MNKKLLFKYWVLLIFFLISLVPFLWIKEGTVIDFWDSSVIGISFEIKDFFQSFKYIWGPSFFSTGRLNTYSLFYMPFSFFYNFLAQISVAPTFCQAILLSLVIFSSLVFTFLFIRELFNKAYKKKSEQIAFFGAMFLIFNFIALWNFWFLLNYSIIVIPLTSLLLFLIIKGLKKPNFFYAFLISLSVIIFLPAFRNPSFAIVILTIPILYYIIFYKFRKLKFIGISIILFALLNSFWLLPFVYSIPEEYSSAISAGLVTHFRTATASSSLITAITTLPSSHYWRWGVKYVPWKNLYYSSPFFIGIEFLFLIVIFLPFLFLGDKSIKDKMILLFFLVISLLGIFLVKAGNPPFGFITQFLITKIPYMGIFRFSTEKFQILVVVGYSVLFGYSMGFIYRKVGSYSKTFAKIMLSVLIFLFSIYSLPFWSGTMITSPLKFENKNVSVFTKIPNYYFELNEYFEKGDYRLLSLPLRPRDHTTFNWTHGHQGVDILGIFFKKPIFSIRIFEKYWDKATLILSKLINNGPREGTFCKVAKLLNIRYGILHYDIDLLYGNYGGHRLNSPEELRNIFKSNFSYIKSFGELDLYKISDEYFLPHIYACP